MYNSTITINNNKIMATYIKNLFINTTIKYLCVKPLDKMEFGSLYSI